MPQPASSAAVISTRARSRPRISRVTGICSTTISRPLSPATRPYWVVLRPSRPITTASVLLPWFMITANRKVMDTSAMNRRSRKTVPRPTCGAPARESRPGSGAVGRDSRTLANTTRAQSAVVAASARKSGWKPLRAISPATAAETPKPMLIAQ